MAGTDMPCCEPMFWTYLLISGTLVAFAGLMSGLTLGLMSLSVFDLEILAKSGQPSEQKNAKKILPIVKNQHLLLCTLLICNALAMEALPIFLDVLVPAWGSILISVTLILAFGEIIPQAVCSRYGLSIGAKLSVVVRLLVIIFFPISYPISKLLDLLLGKEHSAVMRRAELKTLVDMHGNEAGKGGELTHDETTIITGALDLTQKTVRDAMTPISRLFSLDLNSKLDDGTMSLILSKGHSRVPVYSGSSANIIGLILVKNLIKCRPEDENTIRSLTIRKIPRVYESLPLYDMLNQFQKGHSHMAVVVQNKKDFKAIAENDAINEDMYQIKINNDPKQRQNGKEGTRYGNGLDKNPNLYSQAYIMASTGTTIQNSGVNDKSVNVISRSSSNSDDEEIIGIITMEDVLEQLLQEPILDETDEYVDVHNRIKINMVPTMISRSGSPVATSVSRSSSRIPVAFSPSSTHQTHISSNHHSPVLHSPVSPHPRSPFPWPTISNSPGKAIWSSPNHSPRCSPSSHQVSSKFYEKLRKTGDS